MKILHTSDWHLGARIGRLDRADDAFARIDQIIQVLDQEQVDLLLIAGDVFDETRTSPLGGLVRRLAERLAPRVADGLRAVFLAGNHDRDASVFPLLQATSQLFGPAAADRVSFVQNRPCWRSPAGTGLRRSRWPVCPTPPTSATTWKPPAGPAGTSATANSPRPSATGSANSRNSSQPTTAACPRSRSEEHT